MDPYLVAGRLSRCDIAEASAADWRFPIGLPYDPGCVKTQKSKRDEE
jgi:hypothetical protein